MKTNLIILKYNNSSDKERQLSCMVNNIRDILRLNNYIKLNLSDLTFQWDNNRIIMLPISGECSSKIRDRIRGIRICEWKLWDNGEHLSNEQSLELRIACKFGEVNKQ